MYKNIFIFIAILFILSGCDAVSKNDTVAQREITVKNSIQSVVKRDVNIEVSGQEGDKIYANGTIVKSFDATKAEKIALYLDGEDGLKKIKLELEDKDGIFAKPLTLKIYKDTTPPNLELVGNAKLEMLEGTQFKDSGVVAKDNIDKDLNITKIGSVDSEKAGEYKIVYKAIDDAGNSAEIVRNVVVIKKENYNFAPTYTAPEKKIIYYDNQDVKMNAATLFSDKNKEPLRYEAEGLPAGLTLSNEGIITGKLSANASQKSPYKVTLKATDAGRKSVKGSIEIFVKNTTPVTENESVKVMESKSTVIDVLANDKDFDGDALSIAAISKAPQHGKVSIKGSKVEYTPEGNFTGEDSFSYTVKDADGATAEAAVNVNVQKRKNIPLIYLSQDHWDRDNYSLIEAAKKMHQRELIELRAVDVTGIDVDGKGNDIFRAILGGDVDIPVLINHSFAGRATPTSRRFPNLGSFVNGMVSDSDALDSTDYILSDLENVEKEQKVVYVVGGHLHNFASLLLADANLVNEKVDRVVISSGWQDRHSGKPEMNLSEGTYKKSSTSEATHIVFSKFKGEIVMASDPDADYPVLDTSKMNRSSALWYLIAHGKYNDQQLHVGDMEALLYGAVEDSWYGNHWVDKKRAKCSLTSYGAVKLSSSGVVCSYLDNMNSYYTKAVLEELLYRKD